MAQAPLQIRCEVCETVQAPATACASCGMALKLPRGVLPTADPVIERLEGIELTHAEDVGAVRPETMVDLDRGRDEPLTAPPRPEFVPGFETTQQELLDFFDGPDEQLEGMDPTVEAFEKSPPMSEEMSAICPWCKHVQPEGKVCDNCGRSRLRVLPPQNLLTPVDDTDEHARVRCRGCGSIVFQTKLCSECGQPLPRDGE